jgi:O-antigen biosynthesis protein
MTLSVVIVSYNVKEFLEQCLNSVVKSAQASRIETEIFVVDNNSADGSQSMLAAKFGAMPDVHLIFNKTNVGFGKANNQALWLCKGKFILVLNPDTLLQEDTLGKMLAFMQTDDRIGAAGCKLLNGDGSFQLSCRRGFPSPEVSFYKIIGLSRLFPKSERFARYNMTYLSTEETYEVDALMGAFMFLRREILESVGVFDETFFMYGEDLDWCYRIKQAGWKIYYTPVTQIIHYKGESTKKLSFNYVVQFYEAMLIFVKKYYGSSWWFEFALRVGIYSRAALALVRRGLQIVQTPLIDMLFLGIALLVGFKWKFEQYPDAFLEILLPVYIGVWLLSLLSFGQYRSGGNYSIKPIFPALLIGFGVNSSLNFFVKQIAFSRVGLLISYALATLLLVSWRIAVRTVIQKNFSGRMALSKRVAIIGADTSAVEVATRLRAEVAKNYHIVGFISVSERSTISPEIAAGTLLGSLENVAAIASVNKLSELIFVSTELSNTDVLRAITQCNGRTMDFKIVPQGLDVMIGKGAIDELGSSVPLADVEFSLARSSRRIGKRIFDLTVWLPLMALSPLLWAAGHRKIFSALGNVMIGKKTWIGARETASSSVTPTSGGITGKLGVWSLAEIQQAPLANTESVNIYYAKNSSLALDIELLLKALLSPKR